MGRRKRDQGKLFYEFRLEDRIPENHLFRRMNVFVTLALADLHRELEPHYSEIGRPSIDPELMIRMLLVGYCYGIRERRLCQEVELHLAYRWFCKLDLDDAIPHHSTFSANWLGRFRESDVLRHIFERVVWSAMATGLVKGEGFAVDASVLEANASRYHGKPPAELDWTDAQRQRRAVAEYLAAIEAEPQPTETATPERPVGSPRRVPSRRYRAEPEDDGVEAAQAARTGDSVSCARRPRSADRCKAAIRCRFSQRSRSHRRPRCQVSDGALNLGMPKQKLDGAKIAGAAIDQHRLRAP